MACNVENGYAYRADQINKITIRFYNKLNFNE